MACTPKGGLSTGSGATRGLASSYVDVLHEKSETQQILALGCEMPRAIGLGLRPEDGIALMIADGIELATGRESRLVLLRAQEECHVEWAPSCCTQVYLTGAYEVLSGRSPKSVAMETLPKYRDLCNSKSAERHVHVGCFGYVAASAASGAPLNRQEASHVLSLAFEGWAEASGVGID